MVELPLAQEIESLSGLSLMSRITTMMRVAVSVNNPNTPPNGGPPSHSKRSNSESNQCKQQRTATLWRYMELWLRSFDNTTQRTRIWTKTSFLIREACTISLLSPLLPLGWAGLCYLLFAWNCFFAEFLISRLYENITSLQQNYIKCTEKWTVFYALFWYAPVFSFFSVQCKSWEAGRWICNENDGTSTNEMTKLKHYS